MINRTLIGTINKLVRVYFNSEFKESTFGSFYQYQVRFGKMDLK